MAETKVLPNPIAEEDVSPYTQQLNEEFTRKKVLATTAHFANKIRESHPELKEATDDEALQSVHSVDTPNASNQEFWDVLKQVHGEPAELPEPNIVQQGISMGGDFVLSLVNDVLAAPRAISEGVQGMAKVAGEIPNIVSNVPYTGALTPTPGMQEANELFDKSQAHAARAGAFGVGLAATYATAGVVNPITSKITGKLGTSILPRLSKNVISGSSETAAFMGPYTAVREAAKEGATPIDIWTAFSEGTQEGAKFGALLGVGGTIVGTIAKAFKAGKAAKEAQTPAAAKSAAFKFVSIFEPEWAPIDIPPREFAETIISEVYGADVASSSAGKRAIGQIEFKIKEYRDKYVRNAFKDEHTGTGVLEGESPQAAAAKKQIETPDGPLWMVAIEDAPGQVSVQNITAATRELALEKAQSLGNVKEVLPQYERREGQRRSLPGGQQSATGELREIAGRRAEDLQELTNIRDEGIKEVEAVNSANPKDLERIYSERYPGQPVPYKDTEQLRDFLNRESTSKIKGSSLLIKKGEAARASLEVATKPELVKAIVQPSFYDELATMKRNGATDAELESFLRRAHEEYHGPLISELKNDKGKVYAGFHPSLMKKLASKMYKGRLGGIVPKELIQNAIDSVRGKEDGLVFVDIKSKIEGGEGSILIKDNGHGMTPEVMIKELVDLGDSVKPEGASGGFGIAKAAIFSQAKKVKIVSVAEIKGPGFSRKVQSTLEGSGDDWIDPDKGMEVSSKDVSADTPTGTEIMIDFPETNSEGAKTTWDTMSVRNIGYIFQNNLTGIKLDYNVNGVSMSNLQPKTHNKVVSVSIPGSDIDIYTSGEMKDTQFHTGVVLNKGLPQFDLPFSHFRNDVLLPQTILIDVRPTVTPESGHYPFTTNREEVTEEVLTKIQYEITKLAGDSRKRQGDLFEQVVMGAPSFEGTPWRIVDLSGVRSPELVQKIMTTPEYRITLSTLQTAFSKMQERLSQIQGEYSSVDFFGFSTQNTHLGVNLLRENQKNLILINPWITLREVMARVRIGVTPATNEAIADDFAGQLSSTLLHELSHQTEREEGRIGISLTRNIGFVAKEIQKIHDTLYEGIKNEDFKILKILQNHFEEIEKDTLLNPGKNLLAKLSRSLAREGESLVSKSGSKEGEKGRIKSQETVPSSDANSPGFVSTGTTGKGHFSSMMEWVRNKFKIPRKPVSLEKAQMDPMDYLPVQELGKEEINLEGT